MSNQSLNIMSNPVGIVGSSMGIPGSLTGNRFYSRVFKTINREPILRARFRASERHGLETKLIHVASCNLKSTVIKDQINYFTQTV